MHKSRTIKTVRNVTLSILALLVVVVGGGVAYTWYLGQGEPVTDIVVAPVDASTSQPVIKHVKRAPNAKFGASVQSISPSVAPGENASVTIKTAAEAKCSVLVKYGEVESKDSGLAPRVADDFGVAMWTWTVEESVPVGKWPVTVTCKIGKLSAVVQADLKVTK